MIIENPDFLDKAVVNVLDELNKKYGGNLTKLSDVESDLLVCCLSYLRSKSK